MAGFENSAGLGVYNFYGPRDSGKTAGKIKSEGSVSELSYVVDAAMIDGTVPQTAKIPAKAKIIGVYAKVSEAFNLGGTNPTILIGTDTSEVTNGAVLDDSLAEVVGTYDITATLTGTWASELAAETTVGFSLGGTSPTKTTAGKVQFVVRYIELP